METLFCSKCHTDHPVSEFYPLRNDKRGYQRWCKTSGKKHQQIYNAAHIEERKVHKVAYRVQHKEHMQAYDKSYKASAAGKASRERFLKTHPDYYPVYNKNYRQQHLITIRQREQRRRHIHREKLRRQSVAYYAAHRAQAAAYHKQWVQNNRESVRARQSLRRAAKMNAPIKEKVIDLIVFERDRWICQLCFKKVSPTGKGRHKPSRDHVIPLAEGGEESYRNSVLAHLGCNSRKRDRHNIAQQQRLFG